MEKIIVLGTGPQALGIPDAIRPDGQQLLGFVATGGQRRRLTGDAARFPVYDLARFPEELRRELGEFSVVVSDDRAETRPGLIRQVAESGLALASVIHPSAVISPSARLGAGLLIAPGVIVGPAATVGDHVIINSAATIDHDTVLEDNVVLGPAVHLAGGVTVGSGSLLGVGVVSAPGVTIGGNCLIGAGSVVIKDIPEGVVAAGVPAREIRRRE